jgi:chromate reductase, NAD(P)H dehydrogenase (quinone)
MKVVAFAASSSKKSINKRLVTYAAGLIEDAQVEVLDLNDYELPLFSEDREAELGKPQLAQEFIAKIGESDALIISFAEHNGSYSAAYKSLFDWCSRIEPKVFQQKPMVYLSTSPGPGGAKTVLAAAIASSGHFGGELKASLSIPSFYENFDAESGTIKNKELDDDLRKTVAAISH